MASLRYDRELLDKQREAVNGPGFQTLLRELRVKYSEYLTKFTGLVPEAEAHHADPHPKRLLRVEAFRSMLVDGTLGKRLWLRDVLYKLKRIEIAKPAKYGRMIGDLGVQASLQGFRITEALKLAQAGQQVRLNGGTAWFIKTPDYATLTAAFAELINPSGNFCFVYFSDDACYSRRRYGKVEMFNLDISACDTSHGPAIFESLIALGPDAETRDTLRILVEQCTLPIRIVDQENPRRRVRLRPLRPRLYSGSTITTAINNLANLLICHTVTSNSSLDIVQAAQLAGYNVTVQPCECPEDLQFLKHSPTLTSSGQYRPLLNLGVIVRTIGSCKGDLPGRGDIVARARAFNAALINGMAPYADYQVVRNMKQNFGTPTTAANARVSQELPWSATICDGPPSGRQTDLFLDESVYRRYRLTAADVSELEHYSKAGFGWSYVGEALQKILAKDYGLSTTYGLPASTSAPPT